MTVKLAKIQSKERILDIAREKYQVTYKSKPRSDIYVLDPF
jgi:hypothetical protein